MTEMADLPPHSGRATDAAPQAAAAAQAVTALVVSLGDDPRLPGCLEALAAAGVSRSAVCVVWNDAPGPAPDLPWSPGTCLRRAANPGFAASINEALSVTREPLVLVVNPDTLLDPGALRAALGVLNGEPGVGAVAFRLLRPGGVRLDSAGVRLGFLRRARDRGMGEPAAGRFLEPGPVDAACMAGALFRRRALEAARDGAGEVLDARFFAYKEDVDLGWRIRRAGYRIHYEPRARAVHERRWREGARRDIPVLLRRLSLRNRWLTTLKNERLPAFLLRLPCLLLAELACASYLLIREPRVLPAYPMILRELRATLARRKPPAP